MKNEKVALGKMLKGSKGSIYKLSILAAKRAILLADGEKPLIEKPTEKVLDNALREITEGKIKVKNKK